MQKPKPQVVAINDSSTTTMPTSGSVSGGDKNSPVKDKNNWDENSLDLVNKKREHILNRYKNGVGKKGKTEFPRSWSDDNIMENIADILKKNPIKKTDLRGTQYIDGVRDGIKIRINFDKNGQIATAYPTNTPRNPR